MRRDPRDGRAGRVAILVSGNTARFIDQKQSLARPPAARGRRSSPLTTFILLFLLTGSVMLPLKTLLMNSLTLAATLGMLVLAFQEGCWTGRSTTPGPRRSR